MAIFLALRSFLPLLHGMVVSVLMDNTTSLSCVNGQGGTVSQSLCCLTVEFWTWCQDHNIFVATAYVPGLQNVTADRLRLPVPHEWELNWTYLEPVILQWGFPEIDVFTSKSNKKCSLFCSHGGNDPRSLGDNLLLSWAGQHIYLFLPLALMVRIVNKLLRERPTRTLIAMVATPVMVPSLVGPGGEGSLPFPSGSRLVDGSEGPSSLPRCAKPQFDGLETSLVSFPEKAQHVLLNSRKP